MSRRLLAPLVAALVLVAAAMLAAFDDGYGRPSSAAASARSSAPAEPETTDDDPASGGPTEDDLPPDHPPLDPAEMPRADEAPAIAWKVPADWKESPNPNSFRLATYLTPGGGELSVTRAGGSTEENIARWASQFVDAGAPRTQTKTVRGLRVTTVEIVGLYDTGSMDMSGQAAEADLVDQALVAAIVNTPGSPYFFKLLGSRRAVAAARPSFDGLVASITPR